MSYQISWYQENEILLLALEGEPKSAEMQEINQSLIELLDQSPNKLILLINAEALDVGYHTVSLLQNSQKYPYHRKLRQMIVFAPKKLTRLVFLMAFSIASASLKQFEDGQELSYFLQHLTSRSAHS